MWMENGQATKATKRLGRSTLHSFVHSRRIIFRISTKISTKMSLDDVQEDGFALSGGSRNLSKLVNKRLILLSTFDNIRVFPF